MNATVLVLDYSYQPIRVVSWRDAFCWWFSGKIEILKEYEDIVARTANKVFKVPSVIRLLKNFYIKYDISKRIKFNRINLWLRDAGRCQYCGEEISLRSLTIDHVIPKSLSGKTTWENTVVSCFRCNQKKQNRTPEQAGMRLLTKPAKPSILQSRLGIDPSKLPEDWKVFL